MGIELTCEEKIKCKILNDVLYAQMEACFDLSYGGEEMTFKERQKGFMDVTNDYVNKYSIKDFVSDYGLDYFTDQNIITQDDLQFLEANDLI